MSAATVQHGGSGATYVRGCRCDTCRQANTARCGRRRSERKAARVPGPDGRLVATTTDRHGTPGAYSNHGCRCVACTSVFAEYLRTRLTARREATR